MSDTEVLVIGGGPSGAACAISCIQNNLRTVLIESSADASHKIGEHLQPGIEPLLKQLGAWESFLSAGFPTHEGVYVTKGRRTVFRLHGGGAEKPWLGYSVRRDQFESILLGITNNPTGTVLHKTKALDIIKSGERVLGVTTGFGDITADVVIDCTGTTNFLSRRLRLKCSNHSGKLLAYSTFRSVCEKLHVPPHFVFTDYGWHWKSRIDQNITVNTKLILKETTDGNRKEFVSGLQQTTIRVSDVTWRLCDFPAGHGFFVCGDAAARLDPALGNGMLKALMSGIYAAHLVSAMRQNKINDFEGTRLHTTYVKKQFWSDARELASIYATNNLRQ